MQSKAVSIKYTTTDVDESGVRLQDKQEFTGSMLKKEDVYYVSYQSIDDEGNSSKALLKIFDDWMSYKVSGASSADMEFSENGCTKCVYRTPVGNIPMKISTDCYKLDEIDDELNVFIRYELMTIDGGHMANREMEIIIGLK